MDFCPPNPASYCKETIVSICHQIESLGKKIKNNVHQEIFTKTFWDDEALNSKLQIIMNLSFILTRKFKLFEQLFSFRLALDDSSSFIRHFWVLPVRLLIVFETVIIVNLQ